MNDHFVNHVVSITQGRVRRRWTAAAVGSEGRLSANEWMSDCAAARFKVAVARVGTHVTPRAGDGLNNLRTCDYTD